MALNTEVEDPAVEQDDSTQRSQTPPHFDNMASLAAIQAAAAAMFQEAFDEIVGITFDKELENIRRIVVPKLSAKGIPRSILRWAFKLAHGIDLLPLGLPANFKGLGAHGAREPDPRDVIANYCHLQMMYVSGETGEPSVETTGIIEDIVRQQVIEIVSLPRLYRHDSIRQLTR